MEEFEKIDGFENYVISKDGIIKNIKTKHTLKPYKNIYGYMVVCMSENGTCYVKKVHRLVLKTFVFNIFNKPQVNHKNGIKTDNRLDNLEWCTQSENQIHAFNTGLQISSKGENVGSSKLTRMQVIKIRKLYHSGKCSQYELAKKYKITQPSICSIVNNKTWIHV